MDDNQIIELYLSRNERAIAETDAKYGALCRTISRRIVLSESDAEECVNDTYLRTWNSIPPHEPNSLSAFVGRITRNISLDRRRRSLAEKRGGGNFAPFDELSECIPDDSLSVGGQIEQRALCECINAFLAELPREQRVCFMRRYWLGEPLNDIAKRYGMSANGLGVTMHRLRAKLRKKLTESGLV